MSQTLHSWGIAATRFEHGLSLWILVLAVAILLIVFGLLAYMQEREHRRIDREYQNYFKSLDDASGTSKLDKR